ncbi:hypothetical protein F4779DRAFT_620690 [Xylariaceae sp. FL0662B]|nr:hypothetical protein F4779DRAFT_620690 [Xylariaceae sp. FL0662B]
MTDSGNEANTSKKRDPPKWQSRLSNPYWEQECYSSLSPFYVSKRGYSMKRHPTDVVYEDGLYTHSDSESDSASGCPSQSQADRKKKKKQREGQPAAVDKDDDELVIMGPPPRKPNMKGASHSVGVQGQAGLAYAHDGALSYGPVGPQTLERNPTGGYDDEDLPVYSSDESYSDDGAHGSASCSHSCSRSRPHFRDASKKKSTAEGRCDRNNYEDGLIYLSDDEVEERR